MSSLKTALTNEAYNINKCRNVKKEGTYNNANILKIVLSNCYVVYRLLFSVFLRVVCTHILTYSMEQSPS
jgi:hypothetical protein